MDKLIEKIINEKKLTQNEIFKFEKKINSLNIPNDFYEKIKNRTGNYILIKDWDIFNYYFKFNVKENQSENKRINEANKGNSHKKKCSQSLLNYKIINKSGETISTYEILPNKKNPALKKALIIENLETFIDNHFIYKILPDFYDHQIILGNGNYIMSNNFTDYLKEFNEIKCLFDWDIYGIRMFKNIYSKNKNSVWYTVDFFYALAEEIRLRKNIGDFNEIKKLKNDRNKELNKTIDFLIEHQITIEQEIFQNKK